MRCMSGDQASTSSWPPLIPISRVRDHQLSDPDLDPLACAVEIGTTRCRTGKQLSTARFSRYRRAVLSLRQSSSLPLVRIDLLHGFAPEYEPWLVSIAGLCKSEQPGGRAETRVANTRTYDSRSTIEACGCVT